MIPLSAKRALVVGRDPGGDAAVSLLRRKGVSTTQAGVGELDIRTVDAMGSVELVVVSAGSTGMPAGWMAAVRARGGLVIGERELAFQQSFCLHVAVAGATGKRTTTELIAHLLRGAGRRVEVAAGPDQPASALAEGTRDLDFLVHAVEVEELEYFQYFRPVVGVLLNAPERDDAEAGEGGLKRYARLFALQQAFDWAVVESRAMARFEEAGVSLPGKGITFSATSRKADLGYDRGLLVSRMEGWAGPLWDMARGRLHSVHFAEDVLAGLAVGRVLRLGLEDMTSALAGFEAPPGRFELLGEVNGVRFIHDGQSKRMEALDRALMALAPIAPENPFIWLIAGGERAGRHFYDLGPVLSPRVRQAFVLGDAAAAMQAAWQLFTPCTLVDSLLDAAKRAVKQAAPGDVILYSPGCPSRGSLPESEAGTDAFREYFRARLQKAGGGDGPSLSKSDAPGASPGPVSTGSPSSPSSSSPSKLQPESHRSVKPTSFSSQSPRIHRS